MTKKFNRQILFLFIFVSVSNNIFSQIDNYIKNSTNLFLFRTYLNSYFSSDFLPTQNNSEFLSENKIKTITGETGRHHIIADKAMIYDTAKIKENFEFYIFSSKKIDTCGLITSEILTDDTIYWIYKTDTIIKTHDLNDSVSTFFYIFKNNKLHQINNYDINIYFTYKNDFIEKITWYYENKIEKKVNFNHKSTKKKTIIKDKTNKIKYFFKDTLLVEIKTTEKNKKYIFNNDKQLFGVYSLDKDNKPFEIELFFYKGKKLYKKLWEGGFDNSYIIYYYNKQGLVRFITRFNEIDNNKIEIIDIIRFSYEFYK